MLFERSSVIIKDGEKLSFDYIPKDLLHREEQMRRLSMLFRSVIDYGGSETAFLSGSVGTGKTVTAKRFCSDMAEYCYKHSVPMDYVVVNCRQRSTESGILLQMIRHFDPAFPDRGFSTPEMLRTFRGHVTKSGKRFVVVLDEVDVLLKKGGIDLVYQISRFNDDYQSKVSMSMILISQEYVLDRLDESSLSSFKRANVVRFDKYSRDELRDIVASRAEIALKEDTYNQDALDLIADNSEEYGDARFAIDLLDKSARMAEERDEGRLTAEDVRGAKAMIYSVVTQSKLESLDKNRTLALLAVCRSIKNMGYVTISAAEKTYAVVCEEYETTARKHTQFWTYITDLEKNGLIKTTSQKADSGPGGHTAYISLQDIPSKVLAKKLEALLEAMP
ncbi:MAG: AAA family ATPase [Candidatus Methanomethylophilaceae archaeon]|nr:AAA family ATPase [Candidatus Methanomethylophilaceae archaeon]MDY5873069.1 AAA family ATPase [Candidatus Methanomethylophilaceae archaeon]